MKLALLFAFHNEKEWLDLHYPVWVRSDAIDGVIALDTGSTDNSVLSISPGKYDVNIALLREVYGFGPFDKMFNALISAAETLGYDAVLRLDPDELVFPEHIAGIKKLLEQYKLVCLSRYDFWSDRMHYTPALYPDFQARAFRLNEGIRLRGKIHEGVNWSERGWVEGIDVLKDTKYPIYHYGNILPHRKERKLHYINQYQLTHGQEPVKMNDVDFTKVQDAHRDVVPFVGRQPLDPELIGYTAPFSAIRER